MCFVMLPEQTVTFSLYIINRLVSIIEVESVYCSVRTESLYNTDTFRPVTVKGRILNGMQYVLTNGKTACEL
jgi:hypothetical protein